jgi:hypothetical protein
MLMTGRRSAEIRSSELIFSGVNASDGFNILVVAREKRAWRLFLGS